MEEGRFNAWKIRGWPTMVLYSYGVGLDPFGADSKRFWGELRHSLSILKVGPLGPEAAQRRRVGTVRAAQSAAQQSNVLRKSVY